MCTFECGCFRVVVIQVFFASWCCVLFFLSFIDWTTDGLNRLSSSDKISLPSPIYSSTVIEQKIRSASKQSLLDLFSARLDKVKANRKRFSLAQTSLMKRPRPSDGNIIGHTTRHQRRQRRKDIKRDFGKKSIKGDTRIETATSTSSDHSGCNWTFVFDPSGRLCYWWSSVVSIAFLYNFWILIYRFAFQEIDSSTIAIWFTLDYSADLLYILDIAFHFRSGYLEDGVLQTDPTKLRIHYMNTTMFYIDCLCLLPIDFLYLSIGFCSILRCFRLVKVYRFWSFLDRTERHTNYPNVIRTATLIHHLLALFHWNACVYHIVASKMERLPNSWNFPKERHDTLLQYLNALYWSVLTLTTIGDPPTPRSLSEYLFVIFELVFALLLFATVLGHIANIVTNVSAARKEFQARLDSVKTYMALRRVPPKLQDRVIKWFDYLWMCNKSADEEKSLGLLPDKLKAEIAIHVHLDTLKRVEIFQATEAGFLCELVLRLRPVLFSPGDFICRKGEVGKEMYIVNRGRLHVVADNGKTVLASLKPGSYFGEISILNMGTAGNRRTASVRSVGYSDLFCLSKKDLWDVLKEYPAARVKLEAIAVKRLEKYKKAPLEKVSMSRSKSTPGLVESTGKAPLESMVLLRHQTLPAGVINKDSGGTSRDEHEPSALTNTQSEDNLVFRCVTQQQNQQHQQQQQQQQQHSLSSDSQHPVGNMTTSMTISSMASFCGTPPQKSPTCTESGRNPSSTPSSPKNEGSSSRNDTITVVSSAPLVNGHPSLGNVAPQLGLQPISLAAAYHNLTYLNAGQPLGFLSPFCTPPINYPTSPSHFHASSATFQPSSAPTILLPQTPQTPIPLGPIQNQTPVANCSPHTPLVFHHPSQLIASTHAILQQQQPHFNSMSQQHSPLSPLPQRDNCQSDTMVKEISRLRERLAQLEGENSALTIKLNQQQWDVESRLTELEMHICQSDSLASTEFEGDSSRQDSKSTPPTINRESVI
ncbi:hypothetical protein BsWGS_09096 [Bradybaena similaris]